MLFVVLPLSSFGQDVNNNNNYSFTFGIYGGVGENINGYRFNPNIYGNNFYANKLAWNIGVDYSYMATKKLRPHIAVEYLQTYYNTDWVDANLTDMNKTIVFLFNFGMSLHCDYLLINTTSFQAFVSPGLVLDFVIGSDQKDIRNDGTHGWSNYNNIYDEHHANYMGGALSAILKYNVTKQVGIKLEPEYTLFFRKFEVSNDKAYQRFRVNCGVEFNFY